jgi:hypothetical protein
MRCCQKVAPPYARSLYQQVKAWGLREDARPTFQIEPLVSSLTNVVLMKPISGFMGETSDSLHLPAELIC